MLEGLYTVRDKHSDDLSEGTTISCICLHHKMMQSYPPRALYRRLQEDWARDAGEGPRVLMSLRVDFGLMG